MKTGNKTFLTLLLFSFLIMKPVFSFSQEEPDSNPRADILIREISLDLLPAEDKEGVLIKFVIVNEGLADVEGEFNTSVKIFRLAWDGKTVLSQYDWLIKESGIKVKSEKILTREMGRANGYYRVIAFADCENTIDESDEGNNRYEHIFTIGFPAGTGTLPDLRIGAIDPGEGPFKAGEEINISCSVINYGAPLKEGIEVRVILSAPSIEQNFYFPSTGGRETKIMSIQWTPEIPGKSTLRCIVDPEKSIEESDENNNEIILDIQISEKNKTD